jgi:hypothetical protein
MTSLSAHYYLPPSGLWSSPAAQILQPIPKPPRKEFESRPRGRVRVDAVPVTMENYLETSGRKIEQFEKLKEDMGGDVEAKPIQVEEALKKLRWSM